MRNKSLKSWAILLSCLFLFVFVYLLSFKALWLGDDIIYRYHVTTGDEINSLWEAFTSQIAHYLRINGRLPAHFLVQISIAILGQTTFALINSIIYCIFLLMLLKIIGIRRQDHSYVLLISMLILFAFQTKFVPSCQIGYVWTSLLVICYIFIFFKYRSNYSRWNSIWLVPFSVIAGWSQEAIVIGVSIALIVYAVRNIRNMTFNQWIMFFSFGVGAMLLCFAPSTLSRMGETHGSVDFLPPFVYSFVKFAYYTRSLYLLGVYILYLLLKRKASLRQIFDDGFYYFIALFSLLIFNLVIGVFGNRQLFGIELFSVIILIKLLKNYSYDQKLVNTLFVLLVAWNLYFFVKDLRFLNHEEMVYTEIVNKYHNSEDGIVYHDFSRNDVTFYEIYPSDVFTDYVLMTINKQENKKILYSKELRVLPTCCNDNNVKNSRWETSNDGTYNVIINKNDPHMGFVQKRDLQILGIRYPLNGRNYNGIAPTFESDSIMVWTIYDKFPLIRTTDIIFGDE